MLKLRKEVQLKYTSHLVVYCFWIFVAKTSIHPGCGGTRVWGHLGFHLGFHLWCHMSTKLNMINVEDNVNKTRYGKC